LDLRTLAGGGSKQGRDGYDGGGVGAVIDLAAAD